MAGIPQNFQAISPVIANYDYVDILSGTGYVRLYAGTTVDLKLLSNFTYYSDVITEAAVVVATNYTLTFDHDFDVVLNRPLDLRGYGIVNVPLGASTANTSSMYVKVLVRKWDGSTETDLVSNDSRVFVVTATTSYDMVAVDVNIPLTHFKVGETLRLSINVYAKVNAGNSNDYYCHDPLNRTWAGTASGVPSTLTFQCPVRLNL